MKTLRSRLRHRSINLERNESISKKILLRRQALDKLVFYWKKRWRISGKSLWKKQGRLRVNIKRRRGGLSEGRRGVRNEGKGRTLIKGEVITTKIFFYKEYLCRLITSKIISKWGFGLNIWVQVSNIRGNGHCVSLILITTMI